MSDGLSNSINKLKFCVCELFEEANSLKSRLNNIISSGQEYFIKSYATEDLPFDDVKEGTLAYDTTLEVYVYYKDGVWYRVSDDTEVNIGPTATLNLPYDIADGAIAYDTTIGGFVYFDLASLSWYTNDNDNILIASKVSWTPEFIVDDKLSGWHDATEETTLTSGSTGVSGSISEWIERRRGGIRDFVNDNGIAGSQPITGSTSVINSKNTILFDGVNDYMQTRHGLLAEDGETINDWYMYILYRVNTLGQQATLFNQITNSGFFSHAPWTNNKIFFDNPPRPPYRAQTTPFFQANTPYLVEFSSSIIDSKMEILVDAGGTDEGLTGVNPSTTAGYMNIGSRSNNSQFTNASIGEMVYVNGYLQQSEKQQIEGYLANKWGTTASLPVDHPYKNVSPTAIYTNKLINEPLSSGFSNRILPSVVSFTGSASTTVSREYDSSKSEWAQPYTDAIVMDGKLSSINSTTGLNWDLRVGKGGQIYSLITDTLNETIPPQFRPGSPPDSYNAPWVDDCWIQTTRVYGATSATGPEDEFYAIHGCGIYVSDPILKHPYWTPRLATEINIDDKSYSVMNWGLPSASSSTYNYEFRSDIININKYKDLGEGIIEMTMGQFNYSGVPLVRLSMPWGGVRRTSLEYAFLRNKNTDDYTQITKEFGVPGITDIYDYGGWVVFSGTTSGNDESMGFVFGNEDNSDTVHEFIRYGYAGGAFQPGEADWRNFFVLTNIKDYRGRSDGVPDGEGLWSRCYFVFGSSFDDVKTKIETRNLVSSAKIEFMDYKESSTETELISYGFTCTNESFVIRPTTRDSDIKFYLYKSPVLNSSPIYLLTKSDGTPPYLSWDPYTIGTFKMYDGTLSDIQLLGFAVRTSKISESYNYKTMDTIMSSTNNYNPSGRDLSGIVP